jgi:capsular polysaccharide biosynthesis protein
VELLPLAATARRVGLGSASLALPPARVFVLRDALVCPDSRVVVAPDGRVVAETLTQDMVGNVAPEDDELRDAPIEIDGTVALFRSPWRPYFHTLVDHLPRAALLAQPAMRRVGPVTLVHDGPLGAVEQYLLTRLLPPQVQLRQVAPGRAVRADRVLVPGYVTRPMAGAIPSWYRRWIDREADAVSAGPAPRPRRVFIDRRRSPRRVLNQAELEPVLARHGIEAVEPSSLAAQDQIRLFRDAELVLGVTGSGLANTLFSRSAQVVELVPGQELLPHFFYLTTSKGLPYGHVLAPPDRQRLDANQRLRRDVVVDVDALDRLLEQRLGAA